MIVQPLIFSLVTISTLMNNTIANQGNHCIVAVSTGQPALATDNLVLTRSADGCQKQFEPLLLQAFGPFLSALTTGNGDWRVA